MNIQTKIHDKFSIEFKMGFTNRESSDTNNFVVNVWIFTPNNLDINDNTFDKNRFYQNIKSNIRLITPNFSLTDLANSNSLPWQNLHSALSNTHSKDKKINYVFHIKMFAAIFKNSLRHEVDNIQLISETEEKKNVLKNFIQISKPFFINTGISNFILQKKIQILFPCSNLEMNI